MQKERRLFNLLELEKMLKSHYKKQNTDGDIVIIDRDDRTEIKSMAIYAVRIDDGSTVKKLDRDNQHLLLISENKDEEYKTKIIDLEQASENPVIGRVIWCSKAL